MAEAERDDVIVTGVIPFGDSDCVVRLLGRRRGRCSAFARGARASKRRFPGLMAPALGSAMLSSRRGDMLDLKELDVDGRLMNLATDLRAWGFAGYVLELVERFVPDGAPLPELFARIEDTVVALAKHGAKPAVLRAFELRLLDELGVLPDLSEAVDSPGDDVVAYDAGRGALLAASSPTSVPFSEEARQTAIFLLQGDAEDAIALPVDMDVLKMCSRLFSQWLQRQRVTLRSLEVLRQIS